jgi:hypothetical protein
MPPRRYRTYYMKFAPAVGRRSSFLALFISGLSDGFAAERDPGWNYLSTH